MDRRAYHGQRQASNTTKLRLLFGSLFFIWLIPQPEKLVDIEFNRCQIDSAANITDRNDSSALKNFLNYSCCITCRNSESLEWETQNYLHTSII